MFKSYRDLKSNLDVSREQKVLCRTSIIEAEILKKLESKYGKFTEDIFKQDIVHREKARKLKQLESLDLARTRLFINKVRRSTLQKERLKTPEHMETHEAKAKQTKLPMKGASKFREIEVTY
jgi:hypothetical protein